MRPAFPESIETPRLRLRRWRPDDRGAFAAIWSDPDVWRALQPGVPFDAGFGARRFGAHLRHWVDYGFGLLAAEERASGEVAGWIGPTHPLFVPELAAQIELGWTLRRAFWGRGLATEGARAALAASFARLDADEVLSLIAPGNARSIGVAERLGMRHARDVVQPFPELELRVYSIRARFSPAGGGKRTQIALRARPARH